VAFLMYDRGSGHGAAPSALTDAALAQAA